MSYCWIIDNGHGQLTQGKESPLLDDGRQLKEYEFNRDIAERLFKYLDLWGGIEYVDLVPDVAKVGNILQARVQRAIEAESSLPKIYVSIHSNAAPSGPSGWCEPSIHGVETWHYYGSNKGAAIASIFQNNLIKATGWKDRGLKSRMEKQFYVLRNTPFPAILTENGFYNNKKQCVDLLSDEVRERIAFAHFKSIVQIETIAAV
jgi:N-acetylmuramoyl-L-alanine amidase